MKFNIKLQISEDDSKIPYTYTSPNLFDTEAYDICLCVPLNSNFEEVLSNSNVLMMLKREIDEARNDSESLKYSIEAIESILESDLNILSKCQSIELSPSPESVEYLSRNPIINTFDLYLDGIYEVCHEDLDEILAIFNGLKRIKLYVKGNTKPITLSEYEKTVLAIDEILFKIKKYLLSPLEQIMYAYDLIRDRVYEKEEGEEESVSRDITSVLLGDKIVCVGYSVIFEKVLLNLGIKNMHFKMQKVVDKSKGHQRNIVYVKDEKYNVYGVFFFDLTWDRKKSPDDKSYLDSYTFFCRTKDEIDSYALGKYRDITLRGYEEDTIWKFEEIVLKKGISSVPKYMINTFNKVSRFIDGKDVISPLMGVNDPMLQSYLQSSFDLQEVMKDLNRYRALFFDSYLDSKTLLEVLYNVRKIEYYEDPFKYSFDIPFFKKVLVEKPEQNESECKLLLQAIFGIKEPQPKMTREEFVKEAKSKNLAINIERVKLAKVLRLAYDKNNSKSEV